MKYTIKTLGCKANLYDSQLLENQFTNKGWSPSQLDDEADICVINSCTVTDEAEKQSRKWITRLKKKNPNMKVVFTGCSAEVDPDTISKLDGVSHVVGNRDKFRLADLISIPSENAILGTTMGYSDLLSKHPMDREWPEPNSVFMRSLSTDQTRRRRSFLKIQEGCDSFCTYCIIPYGRGPSRSLPVLNIIEQINELTQSGINEVILTGTNIGEYIDQNSKQVFDDLIEKILQDTDLKRLRLSSLDPVEITPKLMHLMETNPRLCGHFHVSLQSPHSQILKLMKRKYNASDVTQSLLKINQLKLHEPVFVGMDVITGFPGETDEIFKESLSLLESLPWTRLHVFPYSERAGTPATKLKGKVLQHLRRDRAQVLRDLSMERLTSQYQDALKSKHPINEVLFEGETKGPFVTENKYWVGGYSKGYKRVLMNVKNPDKYQNQIFDVMPSGLTQDSVQGDVAFIANPLNQTI